MGPDQKRTTAPAQLPVGPDRRRTVGPFQSATARGRRLGVGAVFELGGGDGADGEGGHHQYRVAEDRGVEPGLALVEREAVLGEGEIFFYRPAQPGCPDQPGLGQQLAVGDEAVVKGQLAGAQVAADEQVVARAGGADPGPGVPPLALGAVAGRADLPAPLVRQQPGDGLRAGQLRARGQGEHEVRGNAQDVGLAGGLEVAAQLGAAAVDLVPAVEVRPDPVGGGLGAQVDGQLPLGAEGQVQRQPRDQGLDRVGDLLGRDPLAGADQCVPGAFPHVGQVHGVDPVRHLPAHPRYWRLTPAVAWPAFSCPVSSIAPITIPPRRLPRRAAASSPPTANRRTTPIAAQVSQTAWFSSRCVRSGVCPRHAGRCSTHSPGAARWPAPIRTCRPAVTARSGQNTTAAAPAAHPFPQRQRGAYADRSGRLGSCTRHTGMITRRLPSHRPIP